MHIALKRHPHILKELLQAGASVEPDETNMEPLFMGVLKDWDPDSTKILIRVS